MQNMTITIVNIDGAKLYRYNERILYRKNKVRGYTIGLGSWALSNNDLALIIDHEIMHMLLRKMRLFRANRHLDNIEYYDTEKEKMIKWFHRD